MSLAIIAVFLLAPWAAYGAEVEMDCAYMTLSPSAVVLDTGISSEVFVTILDNEKRPIAGHLINVKNDRPELIMIEPKESLTDADGKATFRLIGLACHDETWCPLKVSFACKDRETPLYID